VFHHYLSQSFSEIGPVVVVLKWPYHGKNFAGVLGREFFWLLVEENANHLDPRAFMHNDPQYRPPASKKLTYITARWVIPATGD
jgi:hypothetical protein